VPPEVVQTTQQRAKVVLRRIDTTRVGFAVCSESEAGFFDASITSPRQPVRTVWVHIPLEAGLICGDPGAALDLLATCARRDQPALTVQCDACQCGGQTCAATTILNNMLADTLLRTHIVVDTITAAYRHHPTAFSVCAEDGEVAVVTVVARGTALDCSRCKSVLNCDHRRAVLLNFDGLLRDGENSAAEASSTQQSAAPPTSAVVQFCQAANATGITSDGEFQPAGPGLRMISANSPPPALFPGIRSAPTVVQQQCIRRVSTVCETARRCYASWLSDNVLGTAPQIPHLNSGWRCSEGGHATETRIFLILQHRAVLVVFINVCLHCHNVDSVDTNYDLFLGALPPTTRPGLGLAICTVRAFYHEMCNSGLPLSRLHDAVQRNADWTAVSDVLKSHNAGPAAPDKAPPIAREIADDPAKFLTYDRLQKTMFACLAKFQLYGAFRQTFDFGCRKHDPKQHDMVVVVDMVHVGMPSNVKPQE
jgi:hypothetical protein